MTFLRSDGYCICSSIRITQEMFLAAFRTSGPFRSVACRTLRHGRGGFKGEAMSLRVEHFSLCRLVG
jgi:hypothetical protein